MWDQWTCVTQQLLHLTSKLDTVSFTGSHQATKHAEASDRKPSVQQTEMPLYQNKQFSQDNRTRCVPSDCELCCLISCCIRILHCVFLSEMPSLKWAIATVEHSVKLNLWGIGYAIFYTQYGFTGGVSWRVNSQQLSHWVKGLTVAERQWEKQHQHSGDISPVDSLTFPSTFSPTEISRTGAAECDQFLLHVTWFDCIPKRFENVFHPLSLTTDDTQNQVWAKPQHVCSISVSACLYGKRSGYEYITFFFF